LQRPLRDKEGMAMPPLALLAGGLATRLGSLTERLPKSLIEVAGEPFIAHQLRMLAGQGITAVVICCGHLGSMIENFVGDGSQFGCRVRYSYDGPALLGTGGAIRKALPLLGHRFWVMYGDSHLTLDFRAAHAAFEASARPGLMIVFRNNDLWDSSNVEFVDRQIIRYAKRTRSTQPGTMQHIDYGLSLYRADTFHKWPEGEAFDLSAVQTDLVARREMAGFEVHNRFYEIGSPTGLRETDAFLRSQLAASAVTMVGAGG
jgi:N-acetyl-alpha-D-muramate 1-phosphate uridylyltransferase